MIEARTAGVAVPDAARLLVGDFTGMFARDLQSGFMGPDVRLLQQFLNLKGFVVASRGPGSPGNETTLFGALARAALARFQAAHGITPPSGCFGPLTRQFIESRVW